ncbi:DUF3265 domain-containing protein [Lactobacillus taiwanensis]|nr:DUF3265 domain-containing protein [Lactobacillus taiwanensis]
MRNVWHFYFAFVEVIKVGVGGFVSALLTP